MTTQLKQTDQIIRTMTRVHIIPEHIAMQSDPLKSSISFLITVSWANKEPIPTQPEI